MKIDILTVFKTENCGSFLQAWALKQQLASMGHTVRFGDYPLSLRLRTKSVVGAAKCCAKLKFTKASYFLEKALCFKNCQRKLEIAHDIKEGADLCFFGSDTLWNFEDSFFKDYAAFFTGADICKPCYTYSMSLGSTSASFFHSNRSIVENIQKFKRIAVRDKHTEDVLSEIYPSEKIAQTIDPTLLVDKETYLKQFSSNKKLPPKTLVIYHFGTIPADAWNALQAFAKKKDLAIVNVGLHEKQFDVSIVPMPDNFISAFSNAEYIFTNTFHGCVFSTIFNKPFATDGFHKKKIEGFLEEFSLLDRAVSSPDDVERVFETPVDYERVNALVKEKRERSIAYLEQCIREVKGNE